MYLDLLNKGLFPKWPEIFASAEKVMSRLQGADLELHDHLKYISQQDANYNAKVLQISFGLYVVVYDHWSKD